MRLIMITFGFALAVAAIAPAHADATRDHAAELVKAFPLSKEQVADPAARRRAISALQSYCRALGSVFPRNSPADDAWFEGELRGGGDRAVRAFSSAEAGRRMAANFVDQCATGTEAYLNANGNKPAALFLLINAITKFAPDADQYASKNGIDPKGWGFIFLESSITNLSEMGIAETLH